MIRNAQDITSNTNAMHSTAIRFFALLYDAIYILTIKTPASRAIAINCDIIEIAYAFIDCPPFS